MRAGIIGFGLSGKTFHLPLLRAEGVEVTSVAVRDASKHVADGGLRFVSIEELCADPAIDLVVVTSPNNSHSTHAIQALRAGKHVVVEKPLAPSIDAARAVTQAAQESRGIVTVFHSRRWDGDFLTLGQVRQQHFDDWAIFESTWRMNKPIAQQRWKDQDALNGGLLTDFMPHLVDQALHLFGRPDCAALDSAVQRQGSPGADFVAITLNYGEKRARLAVDCFSAIEAPRFRLAGLPGEYVCSGMDSQEAQLRQGIDPASPSFGEPDPARTSAFADFAGNRHSVQLKRGGYTAFYRELRLAIETGAPVPVSSHEAEGVVEIIDSLKRNAVWTAN